MTPRSQHASAAATALPDMPLQKWGIESCGAGSLSAVLQHYGDPTTMQQWDATLPKVHGGVMSIDMLLGAQSHGYDAKLVTGTPALVESELRAGRPVILMLQVVAGPLHSLDFYHYVVVDGLDPERSLVRAQFGDAKERWISLAKIEKPWSGGGHAMITIAPLPPDEALRLQLRGAVALEESGQDAAPRYRDILRRFPTSALVWTDLGNAEGRAGRKSEAEAAYRKALELDPSNRDALNNFAWLLYEQKRLDEAEPLAQKAVAAGGADLYARLDTLARVEAARGNCAAAVDAFERALADVPAGQADTRKELTAGLVSTRSTCRR